MMKLIEKRRENYKTAVENLNFKIKNEFWEKLSEFSDEEKK
jgi:tRNA A58 N-methylase Trm61